MRKNFFTIVIKNISIVRGKNSVVGGNFFMQKIICTIKILKGVIEMAVKIGQSYVSEAALSFAKNFADDEKNILQDLSKKFSNMKFSVGTAPFSGTGTNNISISPKILKEMQNNPEKRIEYEALIYDIASQNHSQPGLKSHGFIIGDDGGLRGWGISESGGDKKNISLNKKNKKNWWQKLLPEKNPAAKVEISKKKFADKNELMKHLQKNYSIVKNGAASISDKYLRECLNDEDKQQKLFENLEVASKRFDSLEKNETLKIKIDSDGNMTMEGSKTTVTFNESKRARQLAAAKTKDDVRQILNLLQVDLKQCEEGLKNNWCDEAEVEKVKNMIENANKRMNEIKNTDEKSFSVDVLI